MHEVAPNEVLDLATLNLTVMRYCITRHIRMSFPKIGAHFSQIILNSFATYYSQNFSSIIYKGLVLVITNLEGVRL